MTRPACASPYSLPFMMADLTLNALTTIASRASLIATGQCTADEYRRMVTEKTEAAQASLIALATATPGNAFEAAMMPWLRSVKANARRLRQKD